MKQQEKISSFNSNKVQYYNALKMENEGLGFYADFVVHRFEKEGFHLMKGKNSLTVGITPGYKNGGNKNCSMNFTDREDTISAYIYFITIDHGENNAINEFKKGLSISKRTKNKSSQNSFQNLANKMFENILTNTKSMEMNFSGDLDLSLTEAKKISTNLDFSSSTYKGHSLEFKDAITLDTANTIEAYNTNGYIYYRGLTGEFSDYAEAIEWYKKPAVLGDTSSLSMIAHIYYLGGSKDPGNYTMSMQLYKITADFYC